MHKQRARALAHEPCECVSALGAPAQPCRGINGMRGNENAGMIEASCHCGEVKFAVDAAPAEVNDCSCSICRRYGALWAYYHPSDVHLLAESATNTYMWGDRTIEFHRCRSCGCITYWRAVNRDFGWMGVNARMMLPEILAAATILQNGKRADHAG